MIGVIEGIIRGLGLRLEGLEPCAVKVACTVLRGLGVSNDLWLPGSHEPFCARDLFDKLEICVIRGQFHVNASWHCALTFHPRSSRHPS